jgi:hypothetical protein
MISREKFVPYLPTDPSKNVIYFYLKFWTQSHFLRRFRTKPNTALESKAAFVHSDPIHAIRVNESFAFLTLTG